MTTFHNFALKTETSGTKRIAQTILEIRSVNDVCIYV